MEVLIGIRSNKLDGYIVKWMDQKYLKLYENK